MNIFNHSNPIKINLLCLFWYYQQTLTPTIYSLEASLFKKIHCFSHTNISLLCKYLKNRQFSYTKYIHTRSHNKNTIFTSFSLDVVLNFVMYKISLSEDTLREEEKRAEDRKKKSNQRINFPKEKTNRYRIKKLLVFMYPNISVRTYPPFEFTLHFKTFEFVVQHFLLFFSSSFFVCFLRSMRKWQTKCVDRLWGKCFSEIFWIVLRQILNECLIYGLKTGHDQKSINHRQIKLTLFDVFTNAK